MKHLPSFIQENVPLKDKNWFQTGGPARYFAEPTTEPELRESILFAQEHGLEIFVLGQGANILISDEGFDGLVIRPMLMGITHVDRPSSPDGFFGLLALEERIVVGAGKTINDLIEYCLDHNLGGLEEFSGIPGTVGGSVYINLHYFEFLLEQFLVCARVMHAKTGEVMDVDTAWFNFGYDQSTLMNKEYFLVSATFKLKKITDLEVAHARGRRIEIIRHRIARYPSKNTCGSFFRNFHPHEVTLMSGGKKMIFVAYYLDKIGIKGALQVGGAIVSYQHANMLVNLGTATSTDIINLVRTMQEKVYAEYGIIPQPECQLVGFKESPLMPALVEPLQHIETPLEQ